MEPCDIVGGPEQELKHRRALPRLTVLHWYNSYLNAAQNSQNSLVEKTRSKWNKYATFSEDYRDQGIEELPTDKMIRALYLMNELSCVNGLQFPKNKYGYESVAFTELQDYYF